MRTARTVGLVAVVLAAAVIVGSTTLSRAGSGAAGGLFDGLRKGQAIRLNDLGDRFEIEKPHQRVSTTIEIVEITGDYIAVQDSKRDVTRIPVHAVKSVTIRHGGF